MKWVDDGADGYFLDTDTDTDDIPTALNPIRNDDDCYLIQDDIDADNNGADDIDADSINGEDDDAVSNPGSSDYNYYDEDDDDHCYGIQENDNTKSMLKHYTVLTEAEIRRRQDEQISHVTSVISLSKAEASLLLYHYKWSTSQLLDQWFPDEEAIRRKVGLLSSNGSSSSRRSSTNSGSITCGICFDDDLSVDQVRSLSCGEHYYCWKSYISISIEESGLGCLSLRCPEPKCPAAVGQDTICKFASAQEKRKYFRYVVRSYVECKKDNTKWCPAPGCNNAVEFERSGDNDVYDVTCDCSHVFCFNCAEEPHRPVECKTVIEWINKNKSDAENTKWVLVNCKLCPKCKRPIKKNNGCNHMRCGAPCRHSFCWSCLGPLNNHRNCNKYEPSKDEKSTKEMARQSLLRYSHYYERWASNNKSWQKSIADLHNLKTTQLPTLSDKVKVPVTQLQFIVEGWKQIIECRRVLKWTYAYGYLLLEHEDAKRQLFEFLQGEAESALEKLHHCAEIELTENFLGDGELKTDFNPFRMKLSGLTTVTGTYFENLVKALENGLSEVDSKRPVKRSSKVSLKSTSGSVRHKKRVRVTSYY